MVGMWDRKGMSGGRGGQKMIDCIRGRRKIQAERCRSLGMKIMVLVGHLVSWVFWQVG